MITSEQKARREEWKKHVEEQEKSGLSQIDFCRERHLSRGKFGYYKGLLKPKRTQPGTFTPIKIQPPSSVAEMANSN